MWSGLLETRLPGRARPERSTLRACVAGAAIGAALAAQLAPLGLSAEAARTPRTLSWSETENGGVRLVGASSMTCVTGEDTCADARAGKAGLADDVRDNDAYDLQWVDLDDDESTTNSSATRLRLPDDAKVLKAVLVWGGATGVDVPADPTASPSAETAPPTPESVRFRVPDGEYRTITADAESKADGAYQNAADVTRFVDDGGTGTYWVADIAGQAARGSYAGWGLAVAYRDPDAPERVLSIDADLAPVTRTTPVVHSIPGVESGQDSAAGAEIGLLSWEGDRGRTGDRVEIGGTPLKDDRHPVGNVATSTLAAPFDDEDTRLAGEPSSFGVDVATFTADEARGTLRATTRDDEFALGVVTGQVDVPEEEPVEVTPVEPPDEVATDDEQESSDDEVSVKPVRKIRGLPETPRTSVANIVAAPVITGVDLATTVTGPTVAVPGDEITYTVTVVNNGTAPATLPAFDLSLPAVGTSYSVATSGVTCDGSWHCTWSTSIASGESRTVPVLVQTDPTAGQDDEVSVTATATTSATDVVPTNNEATDSTRFSLLSNLALTATRTSTGLALPGGSISYRATMTNNGPASAVAPQLAVVVPYSARTSFSASAGASCVANSTTMLTCTWSNLPSGQSRSISFTVRTDALLTPGYPLRMTSYASSDNATAARSRAVTTAMQDSASRPIDVSVTQKVTRKVKAGKQGEWEVTVTNNGPYRAHDLVLVQTPAKGVTWLDSDGKAFTKTVYRLDALPPGYSARSLSYFSSPYALTGKFTSSVTQADPDTRNANNKASSTMTFVGSAITTKSGTVTPIKITTTKASSSETSQQVDTTLYDDAGQAIPGTGNGAASTDGSGTTTTEDDESLAETGGPEQQTMWLGLTLVMMGFVTSGASRERRPAPRHRAPVGRLAVALHR